MTHVPLGVSKEEAEALLRATPGARVFIEEGVLKQEHLGIDISVHFAEERVSSVWYNDPQGRESELGMEEKVVAYLSKYGDSSDWQCRMDNGWMRYWYNETAKAMMVYGIHKDVLRFNSWSGARSGV